MNKNMDNTMNSQLIRITGANLVDKYINQVEDLLIQGEQIVLIGKEKIDAFLLEQETAQKDLLVIDGRGKYLAPSLVDLHFHLRNPGLEYKQTYEEASEAAIKGGFTTVVAMANTLPVADSVSVLETVEKAMANLPLEVIQAGAVSMGLQGKELVDFEALLEKTNVFSDDGKNVDDAHLMEAALKKSKELGFILMDHDEPETEMVKRNVALALETGGRLHLCHISKKESIEIIKKAKKETDQITFEVSPHHIFSYDLDYRVNPPIGNKEDHQAILQAIQMDLVDAIATDHAPHTQEDKDNGAPGIINIETAFAMVRQIFFENNISIQKQIQLMSNLPGEILGKDNKIAEGNLANLILFSDKESSIDAGQFATRSVNTPYQGAKTRGVIEYTIVKGKPYHVGGNI